MAVIRIATTRQRDFQPLGTAGQIAIESWSVLTTLLARELSPAHAALFAEPVVDAARGETDWYAEGEGTSIPVGLTDPGVRQAALHQRARLEQDIGDLAARKRSTSDDSQRFLGDMLRLALSIPGDDQVYVLDSRPVLVAWGHASSSAAPEQVALTGRTALPPAPMTILPPPNVPAVKVGRLRRWLIPALLASLLLPLLALLLFVDPFGWYTVNAPACRIADGQPALLAALRDVADREAVLRAALAQITDEAGQRHLRCTPIHVPAPVQPVRSTGDIKRAEERGAHTGKLQIILAWEDRNDLDLHVLCPGSGQLSFDSRQACGGELDVDANGDARTAGASPVENAYFQDPAPGIYRVVVDPYAMRVGVDSPFRITIRRENQPDQVVAGTAHNGQPRREVTQVEVK